MSPNTSNSRAGFILEGRVQGVGFRWWTRRQAAAFGLHGTVRNLPDGAVEVHVEGPGGAVASFLATVRQGPPGAHVTRVRTVPSEGDLPQEFRVIG
jgi:acylphosphatase